MGAGVLAVDQTRNKVILTHMYKIDETNPSSTRPEAFAIYKALTLCHKNGNYTIKSDSKVALLNINKFRNNRLTIRQQLNTENPKIYEAIINEINRIDNPVRLEYIKAHAGHEHNESEDLVAKDAAYLTHIYLRHKIIQI